MRRLHPYTKVRGHTVWLPGIKRGGVVVDAGAHRGEFSGMMTSRFGSRCHLIEANPELGARLQSPTFASVRCAALSGKDGRAHFIKRDNLETGAISDRAHDQDPEPCSIETISLDSMVRQLNLPGINLLKMDIEGAEFELIEKTSDVTLQSIDQITVEFHDFLCEFKNRGLYEKARDRLEALGFLSCNMAFRTHGDVLFLNSARLQLGALEKIYLRLAARYVEKIREYATRDL